MKTYPRLRAFPAIILTLGLGGSLGCQDSPKPAAAQESQPASAASTRAAKAPSSEPKQALHDPKLAKKKAPDQFVVKFKTTKGDILIDVHRDWAPHGADRFFNLVEAGYYSDVAFFRVIAGFMAQVGISGDPELNRIWREARIPDDPVKQSNKPGYVTFATAGPNTRTTQIFINFGDNSRLDRMGFAPFGQVRKESMAVVNQLYVGYGEGAPRGRGPAQGRLQAEGNTYLRSAFPELDYIVEATIVDDSE